MSSQFDRAVELVQTLPKNGPIQSSYEEKLALYSAYKQGEHTSVEGSSPCAAELTSPSYFDCRPSSHRGRCHWSKTRHLRALGSLKVVRPVRLCWARSSGRAQLVHACSISSNVNLISARIAGCRDAWNSRQNMTTDEAMAAYVDVLLKVRLQAVDQLVLADGVCAG